MAGAPDCFATEEEKVRVEEESDGEAEQRAAPKEAEGRAAAPARAARRCGFWMRSVRRLRLATDIAIDAGVRSIRSSMERDGDDGRMGERGEEELEREREWEGEDKKMSSRLSRRRRRRRPVWRPACARRVGTT